MTSGTRLAIARDRVMLGHCALFPTVPSLSNGMQDARDAKRKGAGCPAPSYLVGRYPISSYLVPTTWPLVALPDPTLPCEKRLIFRDRKV